MTYTAAGLLPGNMLTLDEQSFEGSSLGSWVANVNVGTISHQTSTQVLEGNGALVFESAAAGYCSVISGKKPCTPGMPYVASAFIGSYQPYIAGAQFGMIFYDANGAWIPGANVLASVPFSKALQSSNGTFMWTPVCESAVAPWNAYYVGLQLDFNATGANQWSGIDLAYLAQAESQVQLDWLTPNFTPSAANPAWMDMTPYINTAANPIQHTRGRQDDISEVQAGTWSATADNLYGWFTPNMPTSILGSNVTLGSRLQWNMAYQTGVKSWSWNFDANSLGDFNTLTACTVALETTAVHSGTYAMSLTTTAAGGGNYAQWGNGTGQFFAVQPGQTVSASCYAQAVNSSRSCILQILFFDSFGGSISPGVSYSTGDVIGSWTQFSCTGTVPAGAVYCTVRFGINGSGSLSGEVHYVDDFTASVTGAGVVGYARHTTRFDGFLSELDYSVDTTGQYAQVAINAVDVLSWLSNAPELSSWTEETVMSQGPVLHWPLTDPAGSVSAVETSGNNGPPLVSQSLGVSGASTGAFGVAGGIEGQVDSSAGAAATGPINGYGITANTFGSGSAPLQVSIPSAPLALNASWTIEFWATPDSNFTSATEQAVLYMADPGGLLVIVQNASSATQMNSYKWSTSGTGYSIITTGTATTIGTVAGEPIHYQIVSNGAGLTLYANNAVMSTLTFTSAQYSSTKFINFAFGGPLNPSHNNNGFAGVIQQVSIYDFAMGNTQRSINYTVGKQGNWRQYTGSAINSIVTYLGLPSFWVSSTLAQNGLSPVDYVTLTGANPLTAMQYIEQVEQGLLYVNSAGKLCFDGRDARMGAGNAYKVTLPAGAFSNDLGLVSTSQYVQTSAVFSDASGLAVAASDAGTESKVGAFPNGSAASPNSVMALGVNPLLPNVGQPVPYLQDLADWSVNTNASPPLKVVSATVDFKTMNNPADAEWVSPSLVAGQDISDLLELTFTGAPSLPASMDFFIEGVTETYSVTVHTLQFYTSPANTRCWIPGDATFGVLGSTTQLGISEARTEFYDGQGTASTDPGSPALPPTFSASMNQNQSANGFVGMDDIRGMIENLNTIATPPVFVGILTGTESVAANTWTRVPLDTPIIDTVSGYNNYIWGYECQRAGWYEIHMGQGQWGSGAMHSFQAVQVQRPNAGAGWTPIAGQHEQLDLGGWTTSTVWAETTSSTTCYLGLGDTVTFWLYSSFADTNVQLLHVSIHWVGSAGNGID